MRTISTRAVMAGALVVMLAIDPAVAQDEPPQPPSGMVRGGGMMPMMDMMQQMSRMMETCNAMMQAELRQPAPPAPPAMPQNQP